MPDGSDTRAAEPKKPSLLRNISWLGSANVLVKPVWFVFVTAACMRLLGVDEYGVMTAALSLGMIGSAFIDLGMGQYTVREVAKAPETGSLFFTNFMLLRFGNSLVALGGVAAAGLLLGYSGSSLAAVIFAGVYALTLNLTNYCRTIYRAFERLRQEAVMLIVEKVLVIGGGLTLLLATRSAASTLAGMALGMALTTGVNTWWIHRRFAQISLRLLSGDFLRKALRTMIPFGVAGLFTIIYYRVDAVMIEAFLGVAPTGQYGAAFRILEGLNMLPTIVSLAAVYPRLAKLYHEGNTAQFRSLLKKSAAGLGAVSTLVAVALTMFADPVITLLDPDPSYQPAIPALQILVWSFPFYCVNTLLYSALISMDFQKYASMALALVVITNVGLNLFMIPAFGINGAAVATIIPEVLLVGIYLGRYLYGRTR